MQRLRFFLLFCLVLALVPAASFAEETGGAVSTGITIEVFSDFQCPFCRSFAPVLREVQEKGFDGVIPKIVFKHFPLEFHPDAQLAAQAGHAASLQGKFWEMHDLIFANQQAIGREDLVGYATSLGLEMERFLADLDSESTKQVVAADKTEGEKRGVGGTPAFFLNGKAYSGTKTLAELTQLAVGEQKRSWALAEITDGLMSRGPADAPVTLELFVDLESPVSVPAMKVVEQVISQHPSVVRLQFRNFPLAFHPQAPMAHAAAMAAAKKGRFWEFAAYVLAHQESLREQDLIAYAGKLGLDEAEFAAMVQDRRYSPRVDADLAAGLNRGIRGSPVIFVNERRIDGVPSLQTLSEYVEMELAAK